MKLSKYNYYCKTENDKFIIFNTFSSAILKIDSNFLNMLTSNFLLFDKKTIDNLYELGIVINDDYDEMAMLSHDRATNIYSRESITYRILTTTACNARCFYCYESDYALSIMNIQTAEQVVKFIKDNSKLSKEIKIQWFGGEPLLNTKVMYYITKNLVNYFNLACKKYSFSMISNGSLLDKINLDKLFLDKVQISLDGTNDEYNKRKNYINEKNAFYKVVNNINMIASNGIQVSVRLNYDKDNYSNILSLIDYLNNHLTHKKFIHIYPYPLFGTYCDHRHAVNPTTKDDLLLIYKKLCNCNLLSINSLTRLRYQTSRCFACNANSFVIDPSGKLSKCPVGYTNKVGDVFNGIEYNIEFFRWCNNTISLKCEKCTFLPLCQGGCMAGQLGDHSVSCFLNKLIIDDILNMIIS